MKILYKTSYNLGMDFSAYKTSVLKINLGKNLPYSVYLHRDALSLIAKPLSDFLEISNLHFDPDKNDRILLNFIKEDYRYFLLNYPSFFQESYPQLEQSYTVNLINKTVQDEVVIS